jgi:hypothetical protein
VYTPPTTVPTDGETDQFTLVLLDPVTVAFSVADCPPESEAVVGDTLIATGTSEMVELALLVASAALVAFTVMVWAEATVAGAV